MNNRDPYQILGVSPSASETEIKAAYRELAKKYHPDNYSDNPLSDLAQEKMQEINEAYDAILRARRAGGTAGGAYGGAPYTGGAAGGSRYRDIRALINSGRIADAETLLTGIPASQRDAEWHFLKGSVLYRKGWLEDAYQNFVTATRLDPQNAEYREAVNRMDQQRRTGNYSPTGYGGSTMSCTPCDVCSGLMILDCCCRGCR